MSRIRRVDKTKEGEEERRCSPYEITENIHKTEFSMATVATRERKNNTQLFAFYKSGCGTNVEL